MNLFLTGATGYIGGAVGHRLLAEGHTVTALIRDEAKAPALEARGYRTFTAWLEDVAPFQGYLRTFDAVIHCADSDNAGFVSTVIEELAGTGKTFIHTSGSSVVSDKAAGAFAGPPHHDLTPVVPILEKLSRVDIDKAIADASRRDIRTAVICPCMIYGPGQGIQPHSQQVPALIKLAAKHGAPRHIGEGKNIWSNIHIDDLVTLFTLVLAKSGSGIFYFAENGEASLLDVSLAIAKARNQEGRSDSWTVEEASRELGAGAAHLGHGSNSRIRSVAARAALGWSPIHDSLLADTAAGYYGAIA